ncbi:MAG: M28 family peptidase [Saprospiraceae bacterium]
MRLLTILSLTLILACTSTKEVKQTSVTPTVTALMPTSVTVDQALVVKDIRYLASDELGGRGTGSEGIAMAAAYISQVLAEAKVSHVPGENRYKQAVPLVEIAAPVSATLEVADKSFVLREDLLVLDQVAFDASASLRFIGQEGVDAISQMDLKGAIVVTMAGSESEADPRAFYQLAMQKQKAVQQAGGVALIELYRSPRAPFSQVYRFFGAGGLKIDAKDTGRIPLLWLNDPKGNNLQVMDESAGTAIKLSLKPGTRTPVAADNLVGYIEGTDPSLKNEVVVVSAHYDHLGIDGSRGGSDSIFNGARDNALGVAALLGVSRHFGSHPGKRPMIILAVTAEERGLLGSEYFAQQPSLPLKQVVFNLNFDGAGYDDTSSVTINGYGRTTIQKDLDEAIAKSGVRPNPDPVPEMGLYQYSDNWSFAKRGVPALNLAPGFTGFSPELMNYYHQAGDHADDLDFAYVTRYVKAAVAAAGAVVNATERPTWVEGDELVPTGKSLYGK